MGAPLPWFDVNCVIGSRLRPRPENKLSPEETAAALARLGIRQALVRHAHAIEYDAIYGNRLCAEYCRDNAWAVPCFMVVPPFPGEMPGGDALLKYLADGGARAVSMMPGFHGYTWKSPGVDETLSALESGGYPLLEPEGEASLDDIAGILARHPRLHVISLRTAYTLSRQVLALLAQFPTYHLECSRCSFHNVVAEVTERFGAERLVFGTGMPEWDPAAAMAMITYAQITPAQRALIAGDGLRALLRLPAAVEVH